MVYLANPHTAWALQAVKFHRNRFKFENHNGKAVPISVWDRFNSGAPVSHIEEENFEFLNYNQGAIDLFFELSDKTKLAGLTKYGARNLIGVMRWKYEVEVLGAAIDDSFNINDHLTSTLARMFLEVDSGVLDDDLVLDRFEHNYVPFFSIRNGLGEAWDDIIEVHCESVQLLPGKGTPTVGDWVVYNNRMNEMYPDGKVFRDKRYDKVVTPKQVSPAQKAAAEANVAAVS